MKMESEVISREFIKPSSPTPNHLKIHKLSLLDQIVPPIYVPLVMYFPPKENISKDPDFIPQTTQLLRNSLSQTLTRFYPLAGRLKDRLSIDCNDEGVLFVISKVQGTMSGFLEKTDPVQCRGHIACALSWAEPGPGSYIATAQVNYFECGGIAVSSLLLHKATDGVTVGTFMKAWAENAKGLKETSTEFLDIYSAQSLFPQNEAMQREDHLFSAMRQYFKFGKTVMKRYVFDSIAISTLRDRLTSEGIKFRPSRVETVSALLWKCFMVALTETSEKSGSEKKATSVVTHGVNMRRKSDPPLPEQSFGNFVWLVPASSTNETSIEISHLVSKVRNAINKVDSNFVKSMQGEEGFSGYCKNLKEAFDEFPENAEYLAISSWCNFGLYNVDFGWGRPIWMSKCDAASETGWPFINVAWLMDTRNGDGIEAWLTLDERFSEAFDGIKELQVLAKLDPSPLDDMEKVQVFEKIDPKAFDIQGFESKVFVTVDHSSPVEIGASISNNKPVLVHGVY